MLTPVFMVGKRAYTNHLITTAHHSGLEQGLSVFWSPSTLKEVKTLEGSMIQDPVVHKVQSHSPSRITYRPGMGVWL